MKTITQYAAITMVAIASMASSQSHAATIPFSYSSPMFRMGSSVNDSASTLTTTPQLAFPGMTLADIAERADDGYVFGMTQCGTSWAKNTAYQSRDVLVCRDPDTSEVTMISVLFVGYHDGHTKSLAVELTDGVGGVYARAGRAQYLYKTKNTSFVFVEPDGNGGVIYSCDSSNSNKAAAGSVATYNGGGYGCCSLTFAKVLKTSAKMRIFANAPGEPALTVEDIRGHSFSSLFCGYSVAIGYLGTVANGYNNSVEEDGEGRATKLTVDFQMNEGTYTKCVVIEFTNGEDGVYAQAVNSLHAAKSTHPLGTPSTNSGWTAHMSGNPPEYYSVYNDKTSDYGVFTMNATPPASAQPKMLWNKAENMISKTHNVPDVSTLPLLTRTWVKVLDGISLQEMVDDGYELSAYFCGGSVGDKQKVYAKNFHTYTPPGETSISNAVCTFTIYDSGRPRYTKGASVLFESRPDGVYAQYGKGQYFNGNNVNFDFAWLDENGNPVYDCNQESPTATGNNEAPASWTATGYGIAGLKASRFMKQNESRLVFANPVGEPVLTLDDIKDYYLGCSFAGSSISVNDGEGIGMYRAFEYDGNDSVSLMRVEYQVYDGNYNKCSVVNFTNGVDGVYGYVATTRYAGYKAGKLGAHFVNADGTFAGTGGTVVTNSFTAGYGIYDLFATPMVVLDRDTDWSAVDGVISLGDAVVDLAGHNLTLQGVSGNGTLQYPYSQIFNSSNNVMAEVHFNVSGGLTFNNSTVRFGTSNAFLNNNIKFVKEGNGTHVAAIGQASNGGTQIAAGTLKAGVAGTDKPFGATTPAITVPAGCVFDVNGQPGFVNYSFVLNGGTIRSSAGSTAFAQGYLKNVSLTDDSAFKLSGSYGIVGDNYSATSVDLGGHTLSVEISGGTMYLCNATFGVSGGVMDLVGDNYLQSGLNFPDKPGALNTNEARTVDFRVNCRINVLAPLNVHNYVALYGVNANLGNEAINVFGAFKPSPTHNYFHGCRMMDGSTIDLSERTAAIPLVSAFTNTESDRTLKFADGAMVYIDLGGKKFPQGKVISWNEKPENIGTVKFRSAPGERKYAFVAKDDGLYTMSGMVILVK